MIAALAGPLAWETSDRSPTLIETMAIRAAMAAQGGLAITVVGLAVRDAVPSLASSIVAAVACTGALAVTTTQTWFLATGRSLVLPTKVFVGVRLAALVAFAVGWSALAPGALALLIWPLGVYIGSETTITEMLI
ncbi:MAG: hypothetical protein ACK5CE_03875, partial [Actinomycetes bacterium]